MMSYTKIATIFADSEALSGQTVTVGGWVRTIRDLKGFGFIELNDGSCFRNLQIVMEAGALDHYKDIAAQNVGAALIVTGVVALTPDAKQPLELKATEIAVEGTSSPDYPLQKKRHSVEFLRTIQHLRPRTEPVLRHFPGAERGGLCHPQVLPGARLRLRPDPYYHRQRLRGRRRDVPGDDSGSRTTFPKPQDGQVDYSQDFFGKKTSLTVSGQLNAENFAMAFGNVYTFGPTFRAENSNTAAPRRRVLDGRAGDGLCRSERLYGHR